MTLTSPVTQLPGIGNSLAGKLQKLDIVSLLDLLYHIPFRYEDRSLISSTAQVQPGEILSLVGQITEIKNEFTKGHKFIQKAVFTDATGKLPVVWFNQPYLVTTFKKHSQVALWGKIENYRHQLTISSPEFELVNPGQALIHSARLVPIYPETAGISSKWLRTKIWSLLQQLPFTEILPPEIIREFNLPNWSQSLRQVHFPDVLRSVAPSTGRLAFDELFLLYLAATDRRRLWQKVRLTHPLAVDQEKVLHFISQLPFNLTPSQNQAIRDILSDFSSSHPMNRLLEGDVGSGKTVVAAISALVAHYNDLQTLIMAPTQILAQQHHQTLSALFQPLGIQIGLITGTQKLKIENCKLKIIVGTHALLSPKIQPGKVGLIVVDEQHRFGVAQRGLAAAKGVSPHILTMTATPIPRTIALTLYGDLDISVLTDMPSGRKPVKTWVVPEAKRASAYTWISSQISSLKSQVFIVCPFIEPSESLSSVKAATAEFLALKSVFQNFRLGLLHGRLKPTDKNQIISDFRQGNLDILVSTPVVEVGIDIPKASIMLIEGADRFGLAQLHQLRGRVGRSHMQSYCLLFSESSTPRLKAMEKHHSGLELAEIDLRLRGPGQVYGTAQHGTPRFKVASYSHPELFSQAKSAAEKIYPRLKKLPVLQDLLQNDKIDLIQPN